MRSMRARLAQLASAFLLVSRTADGLRLTRNVHVERRRDAPVCRARSSTAKRRPGEFSEKEPPTLLGTSGAPSPPTLEEVEDGPEDRNVGAAECQTSLHEAVTSRTADNVEARAYRAAATVDSATNCALRLGIANAGASGSDARAKPSSCGFRKSAIELLGRSIYSLVAGAAAVW